MDYSILVSIYLSIYIYIQRGGLNLGKYSKARSRLGLGMIWNSLFRASLVEVYGFRIFGFRGSGFWGLGFRGSGFRGLGFRGLGVRGLGVRGLGVRGLGFRGLGVERLRVQWHERTFLEGEGLFSLARLSRWLPSSGRFTVVCFLLPCS